MEQGKKDVYHEEVIAPGDELSKYAKKVGYDSHQNCPAVLVVPHQPTNFRGPVGFLWQKALLREMMDYQVIDGKLRWSMMEAAENDGAGGKPNFFTLLSSEAAFKQLGWEIITMTADDFVRSGRFPAVMVNDLNVNRVTKQNYHLCQALFDGYGQALKQAGLVNLTGEVAIMKYNITSFADTGSPEELVLTWGGTCIGLSRQEQYIDGSAIRHGMDVIALLDPGYRCNGGTFLTNVVLECFGPEVEKIRRNPAAMSFVSQLAVPSLSYARSVCRLMGWKADGGYTGDTIPIAGIAHITGGGVWGKFSELLPSGCGAFLDNMPEPARVLREAQKLSFDTGNPLSDYSAYGTLHGGAGMLAVSDPKYTEKIIRHLAADGIQAQKCGTIEPSGDKEIVIHSRFLEGKTLSSMDNG